MITWDNESFLMIVEKIIKCLSLLVSMPNVLIYDHRCGYCAGFIKTVQRLDHGKHFRFCPFESGEGQKLLRAQFGKKAGFAMYVFTPRTVYWGPGAVRYIVRTLGFPKMVARMAEHVYPTVVRKISKLVGRKHIVRYPSEKRFSMPLSLKARKCLIREDL